MKDCKFKLGDKIRVERRPESDLITKVKMIVDNSSNAPNEIWFLDEHFKAYFLYENDKGLFKLENYEI